MSAIASFYLVPDARLPEVMAAATPAPGRWLKPARDTFWEVLRGAGQELEPFTAGSGWVFNTVDLYLRDRRLVFDRYGDEAASNLLSKARGSYWLVIPSTGAAQLLEELNQVELSLSELVAFITSEHGSAEAAEEARAVEAALPTFKRWLAQVRTGTTGLLSVG